MIIVRRHSGSRVDAGWTVSFLVMWTDTPRLCTFTFINIYYNPSLILSSFTVFTICVYSGRDLKLVYQWQSHSMPAVMCRGKNLGHSMALRWNSYQAYFRGLMATALIIYHETFKNPLWNVLKFGINCINFEHIEFNVRNGTICYSV